MPIQKSLSENFSRHALEIEHMIMNPKNDQHRIT